MKWSWTQPMCDTCWNERSNGQTALRSPVRNTERCACCNQQTQGGIYVRLDPSTVPHPSLPEHPGEDDMKALDQWFDHVGV